MKTKDLTKKEKCFAYGMIGTGFLMGSIVGGTVSECMKNAGWGGLVSSAAGVMITSVYTTTFAVASESIILQNRENKAYEEEVTVSKPVSGRFAWGESDDKKEG